MTNSNARYTFTSYGGGLKLVELLHYPETVPTRREKQPQTNNVATLNTFTPAPTLALLDGEAVQGDGIFKLARTDNGVRAEKTLTNGLSIVKDFQLSTNYLVIATVRLENRSAQPLALPAQEWFVGTATPLGPRDKGLAVGVLWYNGAKTDETWAARATSRGGCRQPRALRSNIAAARATWSGWRPTTSSSRWPPCRSSRPRGSSSAESICPAPPARRRAWWPPTRPPPQGYAAAMVYPALTLAPDQTFERQIVSVRRAEGIPDPGAHWRPVQQQPRPGDELRLGRVCLQGAVAGR